MENSGNDRHRNYGSLQASYTLGSNQFTVQYGQASSWSGFAGVGDSGAWMGTFSYNLHLSKHTQLYALYTRLNNGSNAAYQLGGDPAAHAVPTLRNQHSVALGMWTNF
ncbi:porin [Crenobacter sp. SG2303]|uniref:Porin n=1 Tax=Crenobacter oryzisoli TaxID=3056844 RepID=A0ABT7XSN3_9NEIS|nr:porin [Crenobacter sp. SG2303]MDN0076799.1 porin [Crenobacter sp. SG2303]